MTMITVVVGGQAGSEGKGAVCAHLHKQRKYAVAARVGGPNAGHTAYDSKGRKWALRQLPVAAVIDPNCELVIAAGSEIDLAVLADEIDTVEAAGHQVYDRLYIDHQVTMIDDAARAMEASASISTGTTGKGIGGARALRALRRATLAVEAIPPQYGQVTDTQKYLRTSADLGRSILVEGAQGYILGSHAGYYPYCTSMNCRVVDAMAACGLGMRDACGMLVFRMHPIRIAGESGELPEETSWDELGLDPEQTTVTKKTRRVGRWSWDWAEQALDANRDGRPIDVALMFTDYIWPELYNQKGQTGEAALPDTLRKHLEQIERRGGKVKILGTGPATCLWR